MQTPASGPIEQQASDRADAAPARAFIRYGLLAGVAAALLMTLVQAVLRDELGISPPPEALPERFAPNIPIGLFFWLLGLFGGYNHLKQIGVGSVLVGQLVVGALVGLLYAMLAQRESARRLGGFTRFGISACASAVVLAVMAVLWLGTLAVLAPVLSSSYQGRPEGAATIATAGGVLLAYLSFGVALRLVYGAMVGKKHLSTRRRLLERHSGDARWWSGESARLSWRWRLPAY